jgi:tripartite-type tricarboxylate transporter receptor subunit TctC
MTCRTVWVASSLALALASGAALAQTYPSKPIRIVSPFPPGGTSDILARQIGERLSKEWGQPVVTENRAGAAGNIASEYVARSSPDGHVLYINTVGTHAINPAIYSKLNFDPIKDFTAITNLVALPSLLCAHPSVPVRNVKDLIALARTHPGELSYSSAGSGSQPHLTAEMFKTMTGTKLLHVPYKGASPQMVGLLGGEVAVTWATAPSGVPFVKAGKLRPLGVSSSRRMPVLPDVPTIAEAGVPGYDALGWNGLVGPANMPPAVVQKINAAVVAIFNTPEVRERFIALGSEPIPSTPEAFASLMKAELPKWAKIVKESGARLD